MKAVLHLAGPCLVLAGAGSGKTRVITTRSPACCRPAGWQPGRSRPSPFTNKAAARCASASRALVGGRAAKGLAISTFHSLGVRLLREDGAAIGLKPTFSILDSDDVAGLLRDAAGGVDGRPGAALAVEHQPVEEPGPHARGRPRRRRRTPTRCRRRA
jgi:ATP-dependent DNA helicase Rep